MAYSHHSQPSSAAIRRRTPSVAASLGRFGPLAGASTARHRRQPHHCENDGVANLEGLGCVALVGNRSIMLMLSFVERLRGLMLVLGRFVQCVLRFIRLLHDRQPHDLHKRCNRRGAEGAEGAEIHLYGLLVRLVELRKVLESVVKSLLLALCLLRYHLLQLAYLRVL